MNYSISKRIYSLDSLRAIAALLVVFGHIELLKKENGLDSLINSFPFILNGGHLGVILFYIISGYVITFLLLKEKQEKKYIDLKAFYLRRILRIWPLYYLVLFVSVILFYYIPTFSTTILCITIMANIAHALSIGWQTSPQIWSIGVEEQFYLFWPNFFTHLENKKKLLIIILFFIVAYTLLPHLLLFILIRFGISPESTICIFINKFFYGTKFNCLAMGGALAIIQSMTTIRIFRNKLLLLFSILLPTSLWIFGFELKYFLDECYAICFTFLLATVIQKKYYILNNKILNNLGYISFGIYMYHWIVILLILPYITPIIKTNPILGNLLLYLLILIGTISISIISYNTIEKYFLNIKRKYSRFEGDIVN